MTKQFQLKIFLTLLSLLVLDLIAIKFTTVSPTSIPIPQHFEKILKKTFNLLTMWSIILSTT